MLTQKHFFSGTYIYIETSSPRVKGDKAVLKAGPFTNDVKFCFTFFYHMFGSDIGSLSVYQDWNKTDERLLWTRNTSLGDVWKTSWFDVESDEPFYVRTKYNYSNTRNYITETQGISRLALITLN